MATSSDQAKTENGAVGQQRSIGELTKAVSKDATDLVRAEVELAKQEVAGKLKESAVGAGLLAAAAVLGLIALATLTTTVILALATAMPAWLAALIVTVVVLVITAVLARIGALKLQAGTPPVPSETAESAKEDLQWLKQQTSERK
jgi:uncharacterized membrane protein YqjE